MKYKLNVKIGDCLLLKVSNDKKEYSVYRINIHREELEGEGLSDVFLLETTGFEVGEVPPRVSAPQPARKTEEGVC